MGAMDTKSKTISPGDHLIVRDALGRDLDATATSTPLQGYSFPVVWAALDGRSADHAVPWPLDDVSKA